MPYQLKGKTDSKVGYQKGVITVLCQLSGDHLPKGARWWNIECSRCGQNRVVTSEHLSERKWLSCGNQCKAPRIGNHKLPFGEASKRAQYSSWKVNVLEAGHEYNLTLEQWHSIVSRPCAYCGIEYSKTPGKNFTNNHRNGVYRCNGIDRIDSSKGYILGNCASCCKYCNYSKNDRSIEEFKKWVLKVYSHLKLEEFYALS